MHILTRYGNRPILFRFFVCWHVFFSIPEMSLSDISGITTKAPCEVALMGERHLRIEISGFVMRTFALYSFLSSFPILSAQ